MTDNIVDLRKKLDDKLITKEELFKKTIKEAKEDKCNSFVTIMDKYESNQSKSLLNGIPYALKDNISTKGILTTASSNILKDYIPVFDATIYEKLKNCGAMLIGKTTLDELAMGGTGTTGHTGIVKNPWDLDRQIGGSSAGSVAAVALGIVPFAIGSDTGDSVRKPAAYGGVVGFKPTYGLISRYGLFPFASSLDHLGIIARNVKDICIVLNEVKGHDDKDLTSLLSDDKDYLKLLDNDLKGKKGFYIKEIVDPKSGGIKEILSNFDQVLANLRSLDIIVDEVSFDKDLLAAIYPSYITISSAEATSNNANLTGLFYGPRVNEDDVNKMIIKNRTIGFSELIKRRFVLGSYVLLKENQEKLFLNACRIRRIIVNQINELFKKYDFLILPAAGDIAPNFNENSDRLSDKYLLLENHLQIANFGGMPSITIPSGFVNNMPIGINITGKAKNDELVLAISNKLESLMPYRDQVAKGGNKNV